MKIKKMLSVLVVTGIVIGLGGCAKIGTHCIAPNGNTMYVDTNYKPVIYKDRLSFLNNATYEDVVFNENNVTGELTTMSKLYSASGLFAENIITLDLKNETVILGGQTYICDDAFKKEVSRLKQDRSWYYDDNTSKK